MGKTARVSGLKVSPHVYDRRNLNSADVGGLGFTENSLGTQGSEDSIALFDSRYNTHAEPHRIQSSGERKLSVEANRSEYPTLEMSRTQLQCPMCSKLQGIVAHIVEGLCGFQTELSVKLASDSLGLVGAVRYRVT